MLGREFIPLYEAARRLRCSRVHARALLMEGRMPGAVKVGRIWLIPPEDVAALRRELLLQAGLPADHGGPLPRRGRVGVKPGLRRSPVRRRVREVLRRLGRATSRELSAEIGASAPLVCHYLREMGAVRDADGRWSLPDGDVDV